MLLLATFVAIPGKQYRQRKFGGLEKWQFRCEESATFYIPLSGIVSGVGRKLGRLDTIRLFHAD